MILIYGRVVERQDATFAKFSEEVETPGSIPGASIKYKKKDLF